MWMTEARADGLRAYRQHRAVGVPGLAAVLGLLDDSP